ncbi:hypothetical protein [Neorhizobium sp. T25_13]|uniref:hypothetical protein n=1 Tax=Neorhizobium sp. T25_13 TaxID=2093830 RepID=UPI000CF8CA3B|nr:hypothetical protein [Neorhizobium sp. T25_13]
MAIDPGQEAPAEQPSRTKAYRTLVVDPSDAVTGLSIVFGVVGALVGMIAAVVVTPDLSLALLGYCVLTGLAGGSAGIVTGGMVGAILAVAKGVTPPRDIGKQP